MYNTRDCNYAFNEQIIVIPQVKLSLPYLCHDLALQWHHTVLYPLHLQSWPMHWMSFLSASPYREETEQCVSLGMHRHLQNPRQTKIRNIIHNLLCAVINREECLNCFYFRLVWSHSPRASCAYQEQIDTSRKTVPWPGLKLHIS